MNVWILYDWWPKTCVRGTYIHIHKLVIKVQQICFIWRTECQTTCSKKSKAVKWMTTEPRELKQVWRKSFISYYNNPYSRCIVLCSLLSSCLFWKRSLWWVILWFFLRRQIRCWIFKRFMTLWIRVFLLHGCECSALCSFPYFNY